MNKHKDRIHNKGAHMKTSLITKFALLNLTLSLITISTETSADREPYSDGSNIAADNFSYVDEIERHLVIDPANQGLTGQCQLFRKAVSLKENSEEDWKPMGDAYLTENGIDSKIDETYTVGLAAHQLSFDMSTYGTDKEKFKTINVENPERVKLSCNGIELYASIKEDISSISVDGGYTARNDVAFLRIEAASLDNLKTAIQEGKIKPMKLAGLPVNESESGFDEKKTTEFLKKYELVLVSRANYGYNQSDTGLYITKCKSYDIAYQSEEVILNCDPKRDASGGVLVYAEKTAHGIGKILTDSAGHVLVAGHMSHASNRLKESLLPLMRYSNVLSHVSELQASSSQ